MNAVLKIMLGNRWHTKICSPLSLDLEVIPQVYLSTQQKEIISQYDIFICFHGKLSKAHFLLKVNRFQCLATKL